MEGLAPRDSSVLVEGFALYFDAVDDRDDGGIDGDLLEALSGTGGAALAEHHEFAITGADRIDGDDGVLSVLEFRGVLLVDKLGAQQEEFPADHLLVFFGRDDLSNDFSEEHRREGGRCAREVAFAIAGAVIGLLAWSAGGIVLGQDGVGRFVGTSDDMGADDFTAGCGCGCGAGVDCAFDRCDITGDDCVAEGVADLFHGSDEFDICGFEHRVDADNEAGEAAGFE